MKPSVFPALVHKDCNKRAVVKSECNLECCNRIPQGSLLPHRVHLHSTSVHFVELAASPLGSTNCMETERTIRISILTLLRVSIYLLLVKA
jgi:hypothetical protein